MSHTVQRRVDREITASDGDGWYASAASGPPALSGGINASALAFVQSVEGSDGVFVRSLVVQTNADIHNPRILTGVRLGISVDVIDGQGITLVTYTHVGFAGGWFDPRGNDRAYSWIDNTLMPDARLNRIDHLRIRFASIACARLR
ncbi:hypothetical protein HH310_14895 [Actinoplanes sp. TBRC 11911]|uniref:hypothetical protein n=1 Tax=Actinoplanes sp. TBRC 11911 TaxID=2729386 RepID=UPI00145D82EB|nr:hypothetical protein [Actinoplanes sp. TBRC 11911]NMO52475.1 hypothetical protein [Actinoplanes sp. TBRC 11911]